MKCFILGSCLLLLLSASSLAQRRGPARGSIPSAPPPGVNTNSGGSLFLSGKVVIEDGGQLTEPAAIQSNCRGQKHTEAYTDSHGNFSFEIGRAANSNSAGLADADTSWSSTTSNRTRDLGDCELQAAAAGFTSDSIPLASKIAMGQSNDIGRITLHRLDKVEGLTISATSAAAPGSARKAYEKGRKEELKKNWDQAQQAFEKAVTIYPKYAVAWCELGNVQQEKNDPASARHSFTESISADPQYVNPYRGLAQLAVMGRQWSELVTVTTKLLALNPVNFPDAWFFNALGYYNQHILEPAEKSARQGIHVDAEHRLPKLQLLLGAVLVRRQKYNDAADHLRQFLQLEPSGPDSDLARKQLAEVMQLAAANP
jgi:tetratricopeptide (TPR) repeat protein